jgi:hypothetical protein
MNINGTYKFRTRAYTQGHIKFLVGFQLYTSGEEGENLFFVGIPGMSAIPIKLKYQDFNFFDGTIGTLLKNRGIDRMNWNFSVAGAFNSSSSEDTKFLNYTNGSNDDLSFCFEKTETRITSAGPPGTSQVNPSYVISLGDGYFWGSEVVIAEESVRGINIGCRLWYGEENPPVIYKSVPDFVYASPTVSPEGYRYFDGLSAPITYSIKESISYEPVFGNGDTYGGDRSLVGVNLLRGATHAFFTKKITNYDPGSEGRVSNDEIIFELYDLESGSSTEINRYSYQTTASIERNFFKYHSRPTAWDSGYILKHTLPEEVINPMSTNIDLENLEKFAWAINSSESSTFVNNKIYYIEPIEDPSKLLTEDVVLQLIIIDLDDINNFVFKEIKVTPTILPIDSSSFPVFYYRRLITGVQYYPLPHEE